MMRIAFIAFTVAVLLGYSALGLALEWYLR